MVDAIMESSICVIVLSEYHHMNMNEIWDANASAANMNVTVYASVMSL